MSGTLWSIAGFNILRKGIPALLSDHRWFIVILAIVITTGFTLMFRKVSTSYTNRIVNLEGERFPFYRFMSLKGYLVIGFMMSLGIFLTKIPGMPQSFFAWFYTGLGIGLSYGAVNFFINCFKHRDK